LVREIETEDGAVLLDIQHGICVSLSQTGVEVWQLVKEHRSVVQITERLASTFNVSPAQVFEDVQDFVKGLAGKGIVLSCEDKLPNRDIPRWGLWLLRSVVRQRSAKVPGPRLLLAKAIAALALFDLLGLSRQFVTMYNFLKSCPIATWPATDGAARRICEAVNEACVWYPKHVLCLQRSAVITCLLRSAGVPAQMVMGAQKIPFKAHAWTEVAGSPINEKRDVQKIYAVWERC